MIKNLLFPAFIFLLSVSYSQDSRIWATYSGGAGFDGSKTCLAKDKLGNIYLSGQTSSLSGIGWGGFQGSFGGGTYDAYLAKYNSSGMLVWATYYGASGAEDGTSVATDTFGNVYLGGSTTSISGIASGGAQTTYGGNTDGFIVKFDASGNRLWASYFGAAGFDEITSVAVDGLGNVFAVGTTMSATGIASGGAQNTYGGGAIWGDGFLVKFNSSGAKQWSTYLGGVSDEKGYSVVADIFGNAYFTGSTLSTNFPVANAYQNFLAGAEDAFITKYNASGTIVWSSYYGGSSPDIGYSLCIDPNNNLYLGGSTSSLSGISLNGYQNTIGGGTSDAFMVKFNSAGNRLWATYYGGASSEGSGVVATDKLGNVFLASQTASTSGISSNGFQNTFNGFTDAFLAKFDSVGNRFCATYFGGTNAEYAYGLVADTSGNIYVGGNTKSTSNIASGGFQNTYGGGANDQFIVKFTSCSFPTGISGTKEQEAGIIYPNPGNGKFFVNTGKVTASNELDVFNLLGEKIMHKQITSTTELIDLSVYSNGIYLVQLKLNDKVITKKIIKE